MSAEPAPLPGPWGGIPGPAGAAGRVAQASGTGEAAGATARCGRSPRVGFPGRPPGGGGGGRPPRSGGRQGLLEGGNGPCPARVPLWPGGGPGRPALPRVGTEQPAGVLEAEGSPGICEVRRASGSGGKIPA